jgi:hypothetical protein
VNGTDASGVHGKDETHGGRATTLVRSFFDAERTRLVRAVYLLTGNAGEAEEIVQLRELASGYIS